MVYSAHSPLLVRPPLFELFRTRSFLLSTSNALSARDIVLCSLFVATPTQQSCYTPLLSATLPSHSYPSHQHTDTNTMPGLVNDVTRIWEQNIFWPVNAQCGVWDPKLKGVDIWECVRAREYTVRSGSRVPIADFPSFSADHSTPSTQVCTTPSRVPELPSPTITRPTCVVLDADRCPYTQPPNSQFWRYVTRR